MFGFGITQKYQGLRDLGGTSYHLDGPGGVFALVTVLMHAAALFQLLVLCVRSMVIQRLCIDYGRGATAALVSIFFPVVVGSICVLPGFQMYCHNLRCTAITSGVVP
jgi:hypothetical protein